MIKKFIICFTVNFTTLLFAQWEPDFRLTVDDSVSQTSANCGWCVAAQNDTVHVVWFDYRDGGDKIYYRRSTKGGVSWGPETMLVDTAACYPGAPVVSLAVSQPRGVHIVWCDYIRGADDEIFYKRSTDGGTTWCSDTQLTRDDFRVEADSWASIATWGQAIHVVWHDYKWDGLRYSWNLFYKRSTDGGTSWQPDQKLTTYPATSVVPSIAASGSYVHIVWYDLRDGNREIYYKRSTDNGSTWGSDTRLTNDAAYSYLSTVGVNSLSVHVCWLDDRDGNREIYYKRSTDGGTTWGNDTRLTNDPADSYQPSVSVSGQNVHVVWYDQRDGNFEIYYKRSINNGTTWSQDTSLTADAAASFYPSVAVSGTKIHVVWTDDRDGNREIYYKRNPTGNIGIEEKEVRSKKLEARLKIRPNPFVYFATVLGHENDDFLVYDISGKLVGRYKGVAVGGDLVSGIYFATKIDNKNTSDRADFMPLRLIKVK